MCEAGAAIISLPTQFLASATNVGADKVHQGKDQHGRLAASGIGLGGLSGGRFGKPDSPEPLGA